MEEKQVQLQEFNGEDYYEIVDGSEYEKALSLFHKEEL